MNQFNNKLEKRVKTFIKLSRLSANFTDTCAGWEIE